MELGIVPVILASPRLLPVRRSRPQVPDDSKISVVIDYRPGGMRLWIEAVGAQLVTVFPGAHHKSLGATDIQAHGIEPVTSGISGSDNEGVLVKR